MADATTFPELPDREDCASCPESGPRCAIHESMHQRALERQSLRETSTTSQTEQPSTHQSVSNHGQQVDTSGMSKKAIREMNKAKTKELQMISALRKMDFRDKDQRPLTPKQQKREKQRANAALSGLKPAKTSEQIAKQEEKAAQRKTDPQRLAKLAAFEQKMAEGKSRTQARRARLADRQKHRSKNEVTMQIAETNDEVQHARALQQQAAHYERNSGGPAGRTRGQNATRVVHGRLQELALTHRMPMGNGTDDFLTRADSLIKQTLVSVQSTLSADDRKNLEEALSLVRTTQLLSSDQPYNPWEYGMNEDWIDHVYPKTDTFRRSAVNDYELVIKDVPRPGDDVHIKKEGGDEDEVPVKQKSSAEDDRPIKQEGGVGEDMMTE